MAVDSDQAARTTAALSASLDKTLQREAHHNEQRLATVRAFAACAVAVGDVVVYVAPDVAGIPPLASLTVIVGVAVAVLAVVVLIWLRRSDHSGRLHVALPALDGILITGSFGALLASTDASVVRGEGAMTNAATLCAILAASGGLRLSKMGVWTATTAAVASWLIIATWSLLGVGALAFVAFAIVTAGGLGLVMHSVVERVARAEVERAIVQRFLPGPVVGHEADPLGIITTPRSVEATVLVSDLRNFTATAEDMSPRDVLAFLNRFQGRLADVVRAHGGTVDKFLGDGMLAVFGAIGPMEDHAGAAVRAAAEMLEVLADDDVQIGVGLHSGEVVVGCLGSGARLELTVIGDTVNVASRLQDKTKQLGVSVVVSAATAARLSTETQTELRELGDIAIRGREASMPVYGMSSRSEGT